MEAIRTIERGHMKLATAFVGLHVLDAVLTQLSGIRGTLCEASPLISVLIEQSWGLAWSVKMVITIGGTIALIYLGRKYPGLVTRVFIGFISVMIVVCVINAIAVM